MSAFARPKSSTLTVPSPRTLFLFLLLAGPHTEPGARSQCHGCPVKVSGDYTRAAGQELPRAASATIAESDLLHRPTADLPHLAAGIDFASTM